MFTSHHPVQVMPFLIFNQLYRDCMLTFPTHPVTVYKHEYWHELSIEIFANKNAANYLQFAYRIL